MKKWERRYYEGSNYRRGGKAAQTDRERDRQTGKADWGVALCDVVTYSVANSVALCRCVKYTT